MNDHGVALRRGHWHIKQESLFLRPSFLEKTSIFFAAVDRIKETIVCKQRHIDAMIADMKKYAGERQVGRGHTHWQIGKMGDMEALEDPLPNTSL